MGSSDKLQILAIHGYRQSDRIFREKIGSLRKCFKKEIEFTFIRAPHEVPPIRYELKEAETREEDVRAEEFGWWFNTKEREFRATIPSKSSVGFEESLALIERTFAESVTFDGLFGFSQGAAFVSILCALQQKKFTSIKFDFAILVSGFKSLCEDHARFLCGTQIDLPTLHVYGESDKIIPTEMAEDLSNLFLHKETFLHEGGHYVPGKRFIYEKFILEMLEKKLSRTAIAE